jgi:HEAT repeat protein
MVWSDRIRLCSGSAQSRRKAVERLTATGKSPGLKLLIARLEDPDPQVRSAAAMALGKINEELSVAARVAAQTDVSSEAPATAAATLKEVQDLRRTQSLLKSARDAERTVRRVAIAALGQEPGPSVTATLLSLGDPDARVRQAAAQVLQQQADPAHLPHFLTLLADEHFEVRLTAIQFLRRINDPLVVQALVLRLADSDSDVRRAAVAALGMVRSPVALEPLVLSLTDEEPAVRQAAAAALEEIDPRWVRTDAAQRAIPRLGALRGDPRPWIAAAAETVLEKLRAANDKDTEVWKRESGFRTL